MPSSRPSLSMSLFLLTNCCHICLSTSLKFSSIRAISSIPTPPTPPASSPPLKPGHRVLPSTSCSEEAVVLSLAADESEMCWSARTRQELPDIVRSVVSVHSHRRCTCPFSFSPPPRVNAVVLVTGVSVPGAQAGRLMLSATGSPKRRPCPAKLAPGSSSTSTRRRFPTPSSPRPRSSPPSSPSIEA